MNERFHSKLMKTIHGQKGTDRRAKSLNYEGSIYLIL